MKPRRQSSVCDAGSPGTSPDDRTSLLIGAAVSASLATGWTCCSTLRRTGKTGVSTASLMVLVRSVADLPRACAELSALLALQRRHDPAAEEALLGLWVDPRGVERIPRELRWHAKDGRRGAACILTTAGVEGIWTLCRMSLPEAAPALSQHALLRSLATAFEPVDTDPLPAFFPVFRVDAPASEVQAEARRMVTEHADLVHPPLFHDSRSGWLESPTVDLAPGSRVRGSHAELGSDSRGYGRGQ